VIAMLGSTPLQPILLVLLALWVALPKLQVNKCANNVTMGSSRINLVPPFVDDAMLVDTVNEHFE